MTLPQPPILSESNAYDLPALTRGREYLLILSGDFKDATVTISFLNEATGAYDAVLNGSWTGEDGVSVEERFIAPSSAGRLTLDDAALLTAISVNLVPIL